jgi:hypothetical protein
VSWTPTVYFLEGTLPRPEELAPSFDDFFRDELLRNAEQPCDDLTIDAVRRLRSISPANHWVYTPSVALGGPESIDNVMEMPAVAAMIRAADIASALRASAPGSSVTGVTPRMDDQGRPRLRVSLD